MFSYDYGTTTREGVVIHYEIETSVLALKILAEELAFKGLKIVAINKQGVVIDYIDDRSADRFKMFQEEVRAEINKINSSLFDARMDSLNKKVDEAVIEKEAASFYLLFDFLPEHIKKELKIYIKQE